KSPLLIGATPVAIPANTKWAKLLSRQSRNKIRGSNRFAFLFSLPPLPSLPISEDVYLRLYFADADQAKDDPYWRILANPDTVSYYQYASDLRRFFYQEYRWELMDRWTFSLLSREKQEIEGGHYGFSAVVQYFNAILSDTESVSFDQKLYKLRKTALHFV